MRTWGRKIDTSLRPDQIHIVEPREIRDTLDNGSHKLCKTNTQFNVYFLVDLFTQCRLQPDINFCTGWSATSRSSHFTKYVLVNTLACVRSEVKRNDPLTRVIQPKQYDSMKRRLKVTWSTVASMHRLKRLFTAARRRVPISELRHSYKLVCTAWDHG